MVTSERFQSAIGKLRAILATVDREKVLKEIIDARDAVLARYQQVFAPERIPTLAEEDFKGFLLFKNNQHWTGLARKGSALCSDMPRVREALSILLDDDRPINDRLNCLIPKTGRPFLQNFGRGLLTAILHVTHPGTYGVYNGTSEAGMTALEVLPAFERGAGFCERYLEINKTLQQLASELRTDLWTLDALWWKVKSSSEDDGPEDEGTPDPDDEGDQAFGLERHLHNFMADNWGKLSLGKEWNLYEEDGEIVGYEYVTGEIGKIDLLARHRTEPRWLVIELKRQQTSDDTVGQVLRYMGWVRQNLASDGETVHGIIIARQADAKIKYALMNTVNVGLMCYRVDFHLSEVAGLPGV